MRYEAIIVLLLIVPWFRNSFRSSKWLQKVAFWIAWGGVVVIITTGLFALAVGYHPLLLEAPKYDNILDGISGTLMTFAYTLQFFVLLSLVLVFDALSGGNWTAQIYQAALAAYCFLSVDGDFYHRRIVFDLSAGACDWSRCRGNVSVDFVQELEIVGCMWSRGDPGIVYWL